MTASPGVNHSWQSTYDLAQDALRQGHLAVAERQAAAALDQARDGAGNTTPFVASSLNLLGLVRQRQGHVPLALDLLRQALAVSEAVPHGHANSAAVALNLAHALEDQGLLAAAITAYAQAQKLAEQSAPAPQATAARRQALQGMSRVHAALGQAQAAELYQHQWLQDQPDLLPTQRADALEQQATLLQRQDNWQAAQQAWEQALLLREQSSPTEVEALLRTLNGLAAALDRLQLHDKAAPLHRRAIALLDARRPDDKALANHLNELGLWHLQRKEYSTAQDLLERAQTIVMAYAPAGLQAAHLTANLAQLQEARSNGRQAQALVRQALTMYAALGALPEAQLGQAQALNYLASQDYMRRRTALAEAQFLQALTLTEQAAGMQSPRLLPLLDNLATLYRSQNRPAQAAPYAVRAEQLRGDQPSP